VRELLYIFYPSFLAEYNLINLIEGIIIIREGIVTMEGIVVEGDIAVEVGIAVKEDTIDLAIVTFNFLEF